MCRKTAATNEAIGGKLEVKKGKKTIYLLLKVSSHWAATNGQTTFMRASPEFLVAFATVSTFSCGSQRPCRADT